MWTERAKILTSIPEIKDYIEQIDCFHDYRLGHVSFGSSKNQIMIEEDMGNKTNQGTHIWNFTFKSIDKVEIVMDTFFPSFIGEVEVKDNCLLFSLTNGYIKVKATEVELGIPSF